jgi:diguanylate cyclase (GGDEF)-like protein/PAS domain S-box-containing protein
MGGLTWRRFYVAPSERTPPNPYLKIPERDVVTSKGKALTLMNPAYALRELQDGFSDGSGVRGHITSLKLLNPHNAADDWEIGVLKSFERGNKEAMEVIQIVGQPHLGLMKPFFVEPDCLKCHGQQGYKVGEIRGGISADVPLSIYSADEHKRNIKQAILHGIIWLTGLILFGYLYIREHSFDNERKQTEADLQDSEDRFRTYVEQSADALFVHDITGNFTDVNRRACASLGYSREELLSMNVCDVEMDFDLTQAQAIWRKIQPDQSDMPPLQGHHRRKDGSIFPVEASFGCFDLKGVRYYMGLVRDITLQKQAEESLLITASVFDNSQEAILITDANNTIIEVNAAFTRVTGYSRDEAIGQNPKLLSSGRQDEHFYAAMWESLEQKKYWRGEIWNRRKSGEIYAELLSISAIYGKEQRYVAIFSDISHLKRHEAELMRVANHDMLTGIPNRMLLADRMRQGIAQTSREQNMMAVCYLDLDGFKLINDALGHDSGDQVLIEVARRIGLTVRGGDTVARLGGDEFVVLLLGLKEGNECVATLERLLAAISEPISVRKNIATVSASIGVSIYPLDDEDPDTLLRHADHAMYVAKQSGKNRFYIYDPALDLQARGQHENLERIRRALAEHELLLYYQPKVNMRTGEIIGVEALIRWQYPERGLLPPAFSARYRGTPAVY